MKNRYVVYLAGPISGCSSEQARHWRQAVKADDRWKKWFDFRDPTDSLVGSDASPYELVERDLHAIESADAVLVNMWRESIGSAIGAVHARKMGKVVVVVDPNRIRSRTLAYYADSVNDSVNEGLHSALDLLRGTTDVIVLKRGGAEEPFDRQELVNSLRAASRRAGRDDIVVPALLLPLVGRELAKRVRSRMVNKRISTSEIENAVMTSLSELEADPIRAPAVSGIRAVWDDRASSRRKEPGPRDTPAHGADPERGRNVAVYSKQSHATIWGKGVRSIKDVPSSDARRILECVIGVEGVSEVVLGSMSKGPKQLSPAASLVVSKTPYVLEGRLYDWGSKGHLQAFQVRVHDDGRKTEIAGKIVAALTSAGLSRGR